MISKHRTFFTRFARLAAALLFLSLPTLAEEIGHKTLEVVLNSAESKSYPEIIQIPPVLQPGGTLTNEQNKHL